MDQNPPACACPLPRRIARWVVVIALVLIGAYLVDLWRAASAKDLVPWHTDQALAIREADQTGKPLLMLYTADWCPPCKMLKADVFAKPEMAEQIATDFVPLKLDHDQLTPTQVAQAQTLGITGLPTLIALDASGRPIDRLVGYHDLDATKAWLAQAR